MWEKFFDSWYEYCYPSFVRFDKGCLFLAPVILIGFRKYLSDEHGRNINTLFIYLFIIYLVARKVWVFLVLF